MVPNGWIEGRVGDLLEGLESGVSVNGEDRDFVGDENAVLKVSAVTYGTFDPTAAKVIDGLELDRAKTNPKRGQIIISRSNTEELVGASAYIDRDYPHLFLPDKLWQTIPKQNSDMKWLSYILASSHVRYALSNLATGTSGSMKNITKGELLSLKVLIPSPLEQKKIAQVLSTWDKAISTTEQLLANSQQQKKALMQQLLTGKKRLLDKNGVRFSGEWVHGRLGELCTFKGGSAFKEKYQGHSEGDLPFIKVSDMNLRGNEKYIGYANNWLTNQAAKEIKAKAFPKDAIVFAKVGAALLLNRRRILLRPTIIDNNMMAAIPTSSGDTEFIYQLMLAVDFAKFVQDGAVPSVNQGDLASFKITYPEKEEQQKIAAVLSTADQGITVLQQKLAALKQEKKALMQQLLTGKRRVKVEAAA